MQYNQLSNGKLINSNFSDKKEFTFYVGTYTYGKSEGIYICSFNTSLGSLRLKNVIKGIPNPSYLILSNNGNLLYCVNEISDFEGKNEGTVSAFKINESEETLEFLNKQSSKGAAPCHLAIDKNDRYVIVSNYTSGSIAVLPVNENGSLGEAIQVVQHNGSSVNPKRQSSAHMHSVTFNESNNFIYASDLGLDKIFIYKYDGNEGKIFIENFSCVQISRGAGPRHFVFHPNGKYAYVINELNSTITAFNYNATTGYLTEIQTVSCIPQKYSSDNICADIHIHLTGNFLYGSNRGHNSIVVFSVNKYDGTLSLVQHQSTLGTTPRSFAIDPTGRFLLVANQDSNSIVVFNINLEVCSLSPTEYVLEVPTPTCIKFRYL